MRKILGLYVGGFWKLCFDLQKEQQIKIEGEFKPTVDCLCATRRRLVAVYGLDKDLVTVDSVLMLMDMFAMPYKAVVLRLFESGNISHQQAEKLLEVGSADVMERVSLTGKAKRWQLDTQKSSGLTDEKKAKVWRGARCCWRWAM